MWYDKKVAFASLMCFAECLARRARLFFSSSFLQRKVFFFLLLVPGRTLNNTFSLHFSFSNFSKFSEGKLFVIITRGHISVLQWILREIQPKCENNLTYIKVPWYRQSSWPASIHHLHMLQGHQSCGSRLTVDLIPPLAGWPYCLQT